jgi:hypothetical protein
MELLAALEHTDFSTWLRESDWPYPLLLCAHAIGMGTVVGISFMFSARVLGYAKAFPLAAFDRLFGLAWWGFALNALSGVFLFIGEPRRLIRTPAFSIKMILIVFAGLSIWVLMKALHDTEALPGPDGTLAMRGTVTLNAKVAAVFPVVFWLAAILAGRLIGYTMGPPPL